MSSTHPAFPPLPPHIASSSSQPPIPTTSAQVKTLIKSCQTPSDIRDILIPLLDKVSEGAAQGGNNITDQIKKGEEILALEEENLNELTDEEISGGTAGLIYALSARLSRSRKSITKTHEDDFEAAVRLCTVGDPRQFEWCLARVSILSWSIVRFAQDCKKPELSLQPLTELVRRVSSPTVFSGLQAAFLEACLLTRNYNHGLGGLGHEFIDVAPQTTYLDVLTYHHHAGLICIAEQAFARARDYFIVAVTAPTQVVSAIQLASAKRAILCELLVSGKNIDFPKYISSAVTRVIERNAQEYTKLAKAFEARQWAVVKEIASGKEFIQDSNGGLLEKVVGSITKRRILKVKEMFSRMTIDDLANRVGLGNNEGISEVLAVLTDMIETNAIDAKISVSPSIMDTTTSPKPIVTFNTTHRNFTSRETINKIEKAIEISNWLERSLVQGNREKGISKDWLKKQAAMLEVGGKNSVKGTRSGDDFDSMMAAEDSMVDRAGSGVKGVGGNYGDMGF